jgi:membrane-associated protein
MTGFLIETAHHLTDPIWLIQTYGTLGVAALVFAESGVLIGIFLPGDSLLFAAGLLAGGGVLSYVPLAALVCLAAILGDSFGYWFGRKVGGALFARPDSRFFKQEYLQRTEAFYVKYGPRAIVLARFVPIIRTITPILAGTARMPYGRFLAYNVIGGVAWGLGMVSLGYFLGHAFPALAHYILPISLAIILASFLPIAIKLARGKSAI